MNDKGREVLIRAGLEGRRQIFGSLYDGAGGGCAIWVLMRAGRLSEFGLRPIVDGCHLCGATTQTLHAGQPINDEHNLIVHLNNDHRLDFIAIANKMPGDGAMAQ